MQKKSIVIVAPMIGAAVFFIAFSSKRSAEDKALSEPANQTKHAVPKSQADRELQSRQEIDSVEDSEGSAKIDQPLTPQKAKELLEKAKFIIDITERSKYCRDIIDALCEAGYPEEAWGLIDASFGQVRYWQLSAFFRSASMDSDALYQKFEELHESELSAGMKGLLDRHHKTGNLIEFLTSQDFKTFQESMKNSGMSIDVAKALSLFLQSYIWDNGEKDVAVQRDKMQLVIDIYQNNLLNQEVMTEILKSARLLSPSEKIDYMDSLGDLGRGLDHLQAYRRKLISEAVGENAEVAISTAIEKPLGQQSTMDINNTIRSWIMLDSEGAADWYTRISPSLTPDQKAAAASGFFVVAMDEGQHDTARIWIEEMGDSKMQAGALKHWESVVQERQDHNVSEAQ